MRHLITFLILLLFAVPAYPAMTADLLDSGHGYAVARIGGTPYEMGYAHGSLFADAINAYVPWIHAQLGSRYTKTATAIAATHWPFSLAEQVRGLVDGVRAGHPGSAITADDVRLLNTAGDWGYGPACRSTAAWGSFVKPGVQMLSIRRLDFPTPAGIQPLHLLMVYRPSWSQPYISLAEPGVLICGGTCVREDGTMVSTHNSPDTRAPRPIVANLITRSVATYVALEAGDANEAYTALRPYRPWTGSFTNFYAPHGPAVLTGNRSSGFSMRVPQTAWAGGEVIATSNVITDGRRAPSDWSAVGTYYAGARPKTLDTHWKLLNSIGTSAGFHMLATEYRGPGNMTVRWRGRLVGSTTPTFSVEWAALMGE